MNIPEDRKYLASHEWFCPSDQTVTVGITQLAAEQLSDITYVELPAVGTELSAGEPFGEIESVKATSELLTGVSGKVVEVNAKLADQPELVNSSPYDEGWMIRIEARDLADMKVLLPASEYGSKFADLS